MMRIAVCVKQVPSDKNAQGCMNMYDYAALETALRMKECKGGSVDVFTMGPQSAQEILREALAYGADRAYLLSDPAFAGADVLATAYTLSCGIRRAGSYDVIVCGLKTTNGDTAQVGGELAMELEAVYVPGICEWSEAGEQELYATYMTDGKKITVKAEFPLLVSVDPCISGIRVPTLTERLRSRKKEIYCFNAADIHADTGRTGQAGSATRVVALAQTAADRQAEQLQLHAAEAIEHIYGRVKAWVK